MITLVSSDNKFFTVERDIAERSVLIKTMLEDASDIGESQQPIPLPAVSSPVLEKVLDYCRHHRAEPLPDPDSLDDFSKRAITISEWDQKFIAVERDMVFEIILAANYLDIKALLDLGCKTVADMIKGKDPEEIRKMFGIDNDFTAAENAQIKRENEWTKRY